MAHFLEELINSLGEKTILWIYKEEKKSYGLSQGVDSLTDCIQEKEISRTHKLKFTVVLVQSKGDAQHGEGHGS